MFPWHIDAEFKKQMESDLKGSAYKLDAATLAWVIALGKSYGAYYFSDSPLHHFVTLLEREWFSRQAPRRRRAAKTTSKSRRK